MLIEIGIVFLHIFKLFSVIIVNYSTFLFISDKLHERQRDPDEKARQEVVITICDAASENIDSVTDQVVNTHLFH